jgi:hypothetical protein
MVNTGKPSNGCVQCRARRAKVSLIYYSEKILSDWSISAMGLARIASGAGNTESFAQAIQRLVSYFVISLLLFARRQLRSMRRTVGSKQELSRPLCV